MADLTLTDPGFGSFTWLCTNVPSYPLCNLWYRQLSDAGFTLEDPTTAPVGIEVACGPPKVGNGSLGNIANMIVCGISIFLVALLALHVNKRKAAVGRVELRALVLLYLLTLPLQLVASGAVIEQGSTALVVITAVHAGAVAATFWALLWNGAVSTQVVEDGTMASVIPLYGFSVLFFAGVTYVALDTGLTFTNAFVSSPPESLMNIALFVLTSIWPAVSAIVYFILMTYVILGVLRERKPMLYLFASFVIFVGSQAIYLLASKPLCKVSDAKVDASFIATLMETVSVALLVVTWTSVTEETWEDDRYY